MTRVTTKDPSLWASVDAINGLIRMIEIASKKWNDKHPPSGLTLYLGRKQLNHLRAVYAPTDPAYYNDKTFYGIPVMPVDANYYVRLI